MRVLIHRGTQEIGGTCIELAAAGDRLVLDFGLPLDGEATDSSLVPNIDGDDLRAILISHPHIDHYGLLHHLSGNVPVIMGSAARRIVQAAAPFTKQPLPSLNGLDLAHGKTIDIGVFRITPYLVDHSAYDAYSFLIEAEGKRIFYSGDFRAHGRKAKLYEQLVADPPKNIDALFMEGSSLSRLESDESFPTESDLEEEIAAHLKAAEGMVMFHTSVQNIDRVVTLYRACKRVGRPLIIDLYAAAILAATENKNIPQSDWPGIHLYLPKLQAIQVRKCEWFPLLRQHSANRIYQQNLKTIGRNAVILFRPLMLTDLREAACMDNASFIYSQWIGYLERGTYASMEEWLENTGIPIRHIHTSGHASPKDLKRFAEAIAPRTLIPIHSFATEKYSELFSNIGYRQDGEWWEV
ncbi:MAG: MBL fold metallo-hydrolase [Betaproteobacteria bacterium]|nr:MBL fold metallo-hydrolase [Betaproteobacteria bacterium]